MKPAKLLLTLFLAGGLAGCASVGKPIDQTKVQQIEKGKTTRAEVDKLLGKPTSITMTTSGEISYTYMFSRSDPKPANFIPVVGLFAGGSVGHGETVIIIFDGHSVVKDYLAGQTQIEAGPLIGGPNVKTDSTVAGKRVQ
jgi:outer membrane protein assembly factor BamE (lipoprotein component of BamABCDE complex)